MLVHSVPTNTTTFSPINVRTMKESGESLVRMYHIGNTMVTPAMTRGIAQAVDCSMVLTVYEALCTSNVMIITQHAHA